LLLAGVVLLGIVRPLLLLVFAPFILAIILERLFIIKLLATYFVAFAILFIAIGFFHFSHISPDIISIIQHKRIEFMFSDNQTVGRASSWFYIFNNIICAGIIIYLVVQMIVQRRQPSKNGEIAASTAKSGLLAMTASSIMIFISSLIDLIMIEFIISGEGALSRYEAPLLLLLICSLATISKRET